MKKGLLSLSRDAVERSRQNAYPINAPQRRMTNPPGMPLSPKPAEPPQQIKPEEPQPRPEPQPEPQPKPQTKPVPPRTFTSGFLREALASHAVMAARARGEEPQRQNISRSILSPAPFKAAPPMPAPTEPEVQNTPSAENET